MYERLRDELRRREKPLSWLAKKIGISDQAMYRKFSDDYPNDFRLWEVRGICRVLWVTDPAEAARLFDLVYEEKEGQGCGSV